MTTRVIILDLYWDVHLYLYHMSDKDKTCYQLTIAVDNDVLVWT